MNDCISPDAREVSAPTSAVVRVEARTAAELEAEIGELTAHLGAGEYRWLVLVAEFDRRMGWAESGCCSCVDWMNFRLGISLWMARDKLRVAHALEELPKISEAMALGQLSYSKVRALTRVASAENEQELLSIALQSTAHQVERVVRAFRRATENEVLSREAIQHAARSVSYFHDIDGSLVLRARLPAEVGALLLKALELAADDLATPAHALESTEARRTDALSVVVESFLAHGPKALKGGERQQIVVHVDAETLRQSTAGRCEVDGGSSLAAETARRLACDCSRVTIIENERGEPLDIGRRTRSISTAIQRALASRDHGCRWPGCSHKFVEAHHIRHWVHDGETKLSNLLQLCRRHHRCVHEGGFSIQVQEDGSFRFFRPDGQPVDTATHPAAIGDFRQLFQAHHAEGIRIGPRAASPRWRHRGIDPRLAVLSLLPSQSKH